MKPKREKKTKKLAKTIVNIRIKILLSFLFYIFIYIYWLRAMICEREYRSVCFILFIYLFIFLSSVFNTWQKDLFVNNEKGRMYNVKESKLKY